MERKTFRIEIPPGETCVIATGAGEFRPSLVLKTVGTGLIAHLYAGPASGCEKAIEHGSEVAGHLAALTALVRACADSTEDVKRRLQCIIDDSWNALRNAVCGNEGTQIFSEQCGKDLAQALVKAARCASGCNRVHDYDVVKSIMPEADWLTALVCAAGAWVLPHKLLLVDTTGFPNHNREALLDQLPEYWGYPTHTPLFAERTRSTSTTDKDHEVEVRLYSKNPEVVDLRKLLDGMMSAPILLRRSDLRIDPNFMVMSDDIWERYMFPHLKGIQLPEPPAPKTEPVVSTAA